MNVCNYVYSLNFGDRLTLGIFCCCCCSVAKSCPTIRDPMDCSMPGFPVHHQLPEFAQTHAHWVSDALQPSHPLSSPSSPTFTLSQHQGLPMSQFFTSGGQSIGVLASASVLPVNIQGWFPLRLTGLVSVQSKGFSRVFSSTTVWKHQLFGSHLYVPTGKTTSLTIWTFVLN